MGEKNYYSKVALHGGTRWAVENTCLINFFIGPNNSGKSRKLRELFQSDINNWVTESDAFPFEYALEHWNNGKYMDAIERHFYQTRAIPNWHKFIKQVNGIYANGTPTNIHRILEQIHALDNQLLSINQKDNILSRAIKGINTELCDFDESLRINNLDWQRLYIPTLRSLRHVTASDVYSERTLKDYFVQGNQGRSKFVRGEDIFTGHSFYEVLKAHLLGTHEDRAAVKRYEDYLSEHFFFGQDIALVPRIDQDVVYFKEGDNEERPIYDLGDGIQSIIMLTFKVFMASKPTIFFIEEPEHFLHAGLQRTLIETFCEYPQHMFFMTTHSNHFLDLAQENPYISIQQVQREKNETVVTPASSYGDVLTDLGVRASSVLLANCSIWVEGVTDKLYLRFYMKKFIQDLWKKENRDEAAKLESFHENLHYTFVEYQGSNITHWSFDDEVESSSEKTPAKRLNNKVLLIADADIQGKGDRVTNLGDQLGGKFELLEWKEIENYIPKNFIVKAAKKRWESFIGKGEATERLDNLYTKGEDHFHSKQYGIGYYLELYVDHNGVERSFFNATTGTIKDKVKFCRQAIELMEDDSDWELTPELEQLCRKIWDHIKESN
ncbi:AAA family ATPase [Vibrio coralliilyticus]|uniref:AAA family ATPase n=1 Tax=Vibrio coralliilyticus TaxID=190893 RepID=UPI001E473427|nr:AAA family ATPase [Vibrio coralliilyticus]MCC2521040.1 AAA family ATPase [Vibrio coralliilyticus]